MALRSNRPAPARISVPTRSDPLLAGLVEGVGGPLGRRSAPGVVAPGFFTVHRVLIILTTIAALVSVLAKNPCRVNGWSAPAHFAMACYSDWPELFQSRGFADGALPLLPGGAPFEYPVLLGLLAALTALLVPGGPGDDAAVRAVQYFDINAVLVAGVWILTVSATMRAAHRRPWDAAMVALAPGIILAGTINWDMWAVMLAAIGMLAFARHRPVLAGVLLGLGAAVKVYPVLIFGAILLLALRTGRLRPAALTGAALAVSWSAVNLPFLLLDYPAWSYFLRFTGDRPAGFSSVWFAYNALAERAGLAEASAGFINQAAFVLFALACAAIAVLALAAPRRPRIAQLALLIVAAFLLTNKVYSPQYMLWLVPLVALALPRWRVFLAWQLVEALHWWAVWMYLARITGGGEQTGVPGYYLLSIAAHMLAVAYICYRVVWEILHPEMDKVRQLGGDDPQGGPFDGARDRRRRRSRRPRGRVPRVRLGEAGRQVKEPQ